MKEPVRTTQAPEPKGPYSQGVVTSGRLLYVSGQGPVDPATGEFVVETVSQQVALTLSNLAAVISAAGGGVAQVVKVNAYLSDMRHFAEMNRVYEDFFPEPRPARTTSQSDLPGFDVEIDAIVALDA